MKTIIKNFTGSYEIKVGTHSGDFVKTVAMTQREGSMSFQFDMNPSDARLMAAALIACADEVEGIAP